MSKADHRSRPPIRWGSKVGSWIRQRRNRTVKHHVLLKNTHLLKTDMNLLSPAHQHLGRPWKYLSKNI